MTAEDIVQSYDYDYLVIGGGSGGVSSAKRAATLHNKRVCIVESNRWGGTCVNVGCVPKKIMFQAANVRETLMESAHHYKLGGAGSKGDHRIDWKAMKIARDAYIVRLNNIYKNGLVNAGVTVVEGWASLVDAHTVLVKSPSPDAAATKTITADKILIATGGKPMVPADTPGIEHTITSDGFFELEAQPERAIVVGAGYIAVELAGVLNALGTETHMVVRKHKAIREFDEDISNFLDAEMVRQGIVLHRNTNGVAKVELEADGKKTVTTLSGEVIHGADVVLMAPGRIPNVEDLNLGLAPALPDIVPNTEGLNLPEVGVKQSSRKFIVVDDLQNTSVDNIFAVGDVTGRVELTPMAIAAGRRLADRLFGGFEHAMDKTSYEFVPTVVFSHPTIGTCGLTQKKAEERYGKENIKVYTTTFVNLFYSVFDMEPSEKPKSYAKLICAGIEEKIVGLHMIGK
jgi:glutathione reductase (NADPH)